MPYYRRRYSQRKQRAINLQLEAEQARRELYWQARREISPQFLKLFLATTSSLFAACDKLMALDDDKGNIFGYVIPKDVRAVTGTTTTSHILLVSGSSIEVPISVTCIYALLEQNCPGI